MSQNPLIKMVSRLPFFLICMVLILGTSLTATAQSPLYQLHKDGKIWRYTGTPCNGGNCPGWQMLDNKTDSKAIVADGDLLYQLHKTGKIWQYTGTPCNGDNCPGWQMLDNNADAKMIVAAGTRLYQLYKSGKIFRYTGNPCNGNYCPGWQMLDNNGATTAIVADSAQIIIERSAKTALPQGTLLYQLHNTGRIFRFTGVACNGNYCPGWQMLDNNADTKTIAAAGEKLYQLHKTGKIFRYTGTPCNGNYCPGWQMLDNDPHNKIIAAGGNRLDALQIWPSFQHANYIIRRFTGTPCSGNSCPGWQWLSFDQLPTTIVESRVELYKLYSKWILRFNGTPCTGNTCPGWQMLDNNPNTIAITSR